MDGVIRLGLTGGIGSGKSTVADMLARWGASCIDADAIARQVTAAGGPAIPPILQTFGADFITTGGALDRERMRSLVFADPGARHRLEQIVHPLVGQETLRRANAAVDAGSRCIVYDIPLLVESGRWRTHLDQVLVLDCRAETQIQRVMLRNHLFRSDVERILDNQASRGVRLRAADHVICNDGLSLDQLETMVRQLAARFGL